MPLVPRLHLVELNDTALVPGFLRERVQSVLTLLWLLRIPVLQPHSPAQLVSRTLHGLLGARAAEYTYVDFCAGAGGPTPRIAAEFNALLAQARAASPLAAAANPRRSARTASAAASSTSSAAAPSYAAVAASPAPAAASADFVLTDIAPHLPAWSAAAAADAHVHYVPRPIDAAAFDGALLSEPGAVVLSPRADGRAAAARLAARPAFRLFSLAFHHMPDPLARVMLADALRGSGGFAIFELQGRTVNEVLMALLLAPLAAVLAPLACWRDPLMWLFCLVLPVVPFVVAVDGVVSCLRTREPVELEALIAQCGESTDGWVLRSGYIWHTWPLGKLRWYVAVRE